MSLVWKCDRCGITSDLGDVDDCPEDWRPTTMPVRGSEGAKSTSEVVICADCDDSLYEWWVNGHG